MAEFTELPIAAGGLINRLPYQEMLAALTKRLSIVPFYEGRTAAFAIHNTSGDATSATVEIDTAANEIYLIVVGGVNADNTTLDLTNAAQDTITELVDVIDALGKGWVAVEKAGKQSADALNASQTLGTWGPVDALGVSHTVWFTNFLIVGTPNGMPPYRLIGLVNDYRLGIHNFGFEPQNHFARESTLVDLVGIRPSIYTRATLHDDAFGYNNVGWDPPGAPDLTPPSLLHKKLWNNMKACYDLLIWAIDGPHIGNAGGGFTGTRYSNEDDWDGAFWGVARTAAFAGIVETGAAAALGRYGSVEEDLDGNEIKVHVTDPKRSIPDYTDVVDAPTSFDDMYVCIEWDGWTPGFDEDQTTPFPIDLYANDVKIRTNPYNMNVTEEDITGNAATTATADKSLGDIDKFDGYSLAGIVCTITASTGGNIGDFTIVSNTKDKLIFTTDPGNGTAVSYTLTAVRKVIVLECDLFAAAGIAFDGSDTFEIRYTGAVTDDAGADWGAPPDGNEYTWFSGPAINWTLTIYYKFSWN